MKMAKKQLTVTSNGSKSLKIESGIGRSGGRDYDHAYASTHHISLEAANFVLLPRIVLPLPPPPFSNFLLPFSCMVGLLPLVK